MFFRVGGFFVVWSDISFFFFNFGMEEGAGLGLGGFNFGVLRFIRVFFVDGYLFFFGFRLSFRVIFFSISFFVDVFLGF